MAFIIPLFIIITALLYFYLGKNSLRDSAIKSFLLTFLIILISTEILSIFNVITFSWILISWVLSLAGVVIGLMFRWRSQGNLDLTSTSSNKVQNKNGSHSFHYICGAIIITILLITLFIALKAPPNNYDSMTYHMARVSHWIQNQSIRYYPTAIPRQNYSMPLAEYAILHLQLLSKSDQYANLVQWFSFVIAIILSTQISRELKVSAKGQWITGIITATLPMAILQSTSTQNDLVVGVFCLSFFYFLLRAVNTLDWEDLFFASLSMGFALGTKGTAYVFCAAIGVTIGGIHLLKKKWGEIKGFVLRYSFIIVMALLLNTGIYSRNIALYNNPIFTSNERTITDEVSAKVLVSNVIRNGAVHLATPVDRSNQFLNKFIVNLLGSEINNPSSTFQNSKFQVAFYISDDDSGNLIHFLLLTLSFFIIPWLKNNQPRTINSVLISSALSIILFSLFFKWQPWGGRLQTPIFLLGSVLIAYLIDKLTTKNIIPGVIITVFLITSIPYLLMNTIRPVLPLWENDTVFYNTKVKEFIYTRVTKFVKQRPTLRKNLTPIASLFYEGRSVIHTERKELYFLGNFIDYYSYRSATKIIRDNDPHKIGLMMDSNDWEYPIWVLLRQPASKGPIQINHIQVEDISGRLESPQDKIPEYILATNNKYQKMIDLHGYELVYTSGSIQVLRLPD